MKIVQLTSQNVKRLKAVTIRPDGSVVHIRGNNGQGKTSVLDSIAYALGGKDAHPPEVIRRGAEKAEVIVDLGDLVVERRWTANDRSTVTVRATDGAKYPSPQTLLDGLVGRLSFDPLAFMRMEPATQAETLRRLVGLDFTVLDRKRAGLFETRTDVNREIKAMEARLARMPAVEVPEEPVSVDELLAEQQAALEQKAENDKARRKLEVATAEHKDATERLTMAQRRVATIEAELEEAREEVAAAEKAIADVKARGKDLRKTVLALQDPDLDAIADKLRQASQVNDQVRAAKERAAEDKALCAKTAEADKLTDQLVAIEKQKADALAAAKFPVDGLAFGEEGLTFNGLPLVQASSAEQLRVSVAMGLALNPKLKVLLVRDGSLLDENSLRMVAEMAEEADAQVWIESVGKRGEVGVVIEDGRVVETREAAAGAEA